MKKLNIFKKVVLNNQITWKNGELFVWTVPGFITPTYTFIKIIRNLKQKCAEVNDILYAIGKEQTLLAVEYMMKKFGINDKMKIINSVLEQSSLLGYGKFEIVRLNLNAGKAAFKTLNNPFAKQYKFLYGQQSDSVDFYLAGTKAGIIEAITGKKQICTETKCIAKGDSCCVFEVKAVDTLNNGLLKDNRLEKEKKIYSSSK